MYYEKVSRLNITIIIIIIIIIVTKVSGELSMTGSMVGLMLCRSQRLWRQSEVKSQY